MNSGDTNSELSMEELCNIGEGEEARVCNLIGGIKLSPRRPRRVTASTMKWRAIYCRRVTRTFKVHLSGQVLIGY